MEKYLNFFKEKKKIIIVLLIALFLFLYYPNLMSLVPGPEGVRALNYGVQFSAYGNVLRVSQLDPLPQYFKFGSPLPSIMTLIHEKEPGEPFIVFEPSWYYEHDSGELRSEVQRPILQDDPLGIGTKTIQYYKVNYVGDKAEIHVVTAKVLPADFVIQLNIIPGSGLYTFKDINIWYALDSVVWENAYPSDPKPLTEKGAKLTSSNYRGSYPILAWIQKYQDWVWKREDGTYVSFPPDEHAVAFCQLDPSLEGRFIDLFTSPSSKYDLMLSYEVAKSDIENAIKDKILPDPRFSRTVFFKIRLIKFGAYVKPTGLFGSYMSREYWYPAVYYRLRVVYVVCGEHVYLWDKINADALGYTSTTWAIRTTEKEEYVDPFQALIRAIVSVFTAIATGFSYGILIFIVLIIIAIIILFRGGEKEK